MLGNKYMYIPEELKLLPKDTLSPYVHEKLAVHRSGETKETKVCPPHHPFAFKYNQFYHTTNTVKEATQRAKIYRVTKHKLTF